MIESVHCPECQTHYGLRRERVRYGIRRARCFRCEGVFSIEEEVTHLLAAGLPQESSALPFLGETFKFSPMAIDSAQVEPPTIESVQLDASTLEPIYQEPSVFDEDSYDLPVPMEPVGLAELPVEMPDSLTLHDLEGAEEEILDKTLVDYRPPTAPIDLPTPAEVPPGATTTGGGGYSSARDAIDKLLGGMGSTTAPTPHHARATGSMDVEATLSALDDTLGGSRIFQTAPPPPPELPVLDFDTSLMNIPEPLAALKSEAAAPATVRLSREEIMAAMASAPEPDQTVGMPIQHFPEAHDELESTLVMLTPPPSFREAPVPPPPVTVPTAFMPLEESHDQNLFRVQVGTETLSNLTMEQMTELVTQGRLADYNMVARQFSENWIEAGKVPALRPIFERVRRERLAFEPPPANTLESEVPKRSLFGGLFGRKEG